MSRLTLSVMTVVMVALVTTACAASPAGQSADTDQGSLVVARVDGVEVTSGELEAEPDPAMMKLRQQMYDAKMKVLDRKIFNILSSKAAEEAGVPLEEWIKQNLDLTEPSEEEIAKVMAQYRARLPKEDDEARKQVVDYLKRNSANKAEFALQRKLKAAASIEILIEPPRVEPIIGDHSPSRGPADAPVVLVEYTDFQCPYCGKVQPTLEKLRERYGDSIRMVFKNLPLAMHQQAAFAAEAALCAGDQDGFWPMHDWLFANHSAINREAVLAQAKEQGLDVEALTSCIDEGRHKAEIQADAKEANSFGITGTPGFAVNGRLLTGAQPLESFVKVIDDELRRAGVAVPEPKPEPKPEAAEASAEATSEKAAS